MIVHAMKRYTLWEKCNQFIDDNGIQTYSDVFCENDKELDDNLRKLLWEMLQLIGAAEKPNLERWKHLTANQPMAGVEKMYQT